MGTLFNTGQGNIEVPKAQVPDDGLYHPNEYQGGVSALAVPSNEAVHAPAVLATAVAETKPVQVKWQATSEPTQYVTQTPLTISKEPTQYATQAPHAMSTTTTESVASLTAPTSYYMPTTESVASLTTPTSYKTAGPDEGTATMSPLVPASKPDHSFAYAIASVLVVVALIGGFILYWLRKKDKRLRSKLTMYNKPGHQTPDEPNPHMEQLKRLGCSIKNKSAVSLEAISNMVKKNDDSTDQLRSLESNQSETWPSLPPAVTDDDYLSMPAQSPPTKTERFKELGVKVKDTGLMIKEKSLIARDKGSDLVRDKSMLVKKGSAIMTDKGMGFFNSASDHLRNKSSMVVRKGSAIMAGKSVTFFNSASDRLTSRNNTADSASNYSTTLSASTSSASSDRFHDSPESTHNSEMPFTSNPVCEHNSTGRPSAPALSVSLRNVSSGKVENVHSPTATAPSSCTVSRVSSLTAKSEAARSEARSEARSDAAKSEAAKSEAAKSEAAKSDAAKSEATRSEAARSEAARSEVARSEVARSEVARSEAARSEAAVPIPVPLRIGTHASASTSSIEVFRKKVYRVDMSHKARSESQLAVQEGEYAMISRIFDDGWAYCEMADGKRKGLVPRACLSSWPSNRHIESPVTSPTRCISPMGLGLPTRSPDVYAPPLTQLSSQSRFYGADSVSDYGS